MHVPIPKNVHVVYMSFFGWVSSIFIWGVGDIKVWDLFFYIRVFVFKSNGSNSVTKTAIMRI
jgi:hypothetical protein